MNEETLLMNTKVAAIMTSLMDSGRIILKKMRILPAPTSCALSTIELEMPDRAAEMIMVAKGMLNQRFAMMMPLALYNSPGLKS